MAFTNNPESKDINNQFTFIYDHERNTNGDIHVRLLEENKLFGITYYLSSKSHREPM